MNIDIKNLGYSYDAWKDIITQLDEVEGLYPDERDLLVKLEEIKPLVIGANDIDLLKCLAEDLLGVTWHDA